VLEGDIPPPTFIDPQFPPTLEAIVMKALEVDPSDRYTNCDHLYRDLEGFLQESGLSCTPRKISAMMVELFGEGAPGKVSYDDQYDDLERSGILDFADFDRVDDSAPDDDEPPEWARDIGDGDAPESKRRALTIGNLEALVSQGGLDESGPNAVLSPGGQAGVARSGHHRIVPVAEAAVAERTRGSTRKTGAARSTPPGPQTALRPGGKQTGRHPQGRSKTSPGTGRHAVQTAGPLAAVGPDAASGRSFGQSVVVEQKKGGAAWVWILAVAGLGGLAYFAYILFTSK
jgi:hypothetical protein